jgi:hypothetical protein
VACHRVSLAEDVGRGKRRTAAQSKKAEVRLGELTSMQQGYEVKQSVNKKVSADDRDRRPEMAPQRIRQEYPASPALQ